MFIKVAAAGLITAGVIFLTMLATDLMSLKSYFSLLGWPALVLIVSMYLKLMYILFKHSDSNKKTEIKNENV